MSSKRGPLDADNRSLQSLMTDLYKHTREVQLCIYELLNFPTNGTCLWIMKMHGWGARDIRGTGRTRTDVNEKLDHVVKPHVWPNRLPGVDASYRFSLLVRPEVFGRNYILYQLNLFMFTVLTLFTICNKLTWDSIRCFGQRVLLTSAETNFLLVLDISY